MAVARADATQRLTQAGNAAQRARYLPRVLTGELIGAMGMTAPKPTGAWALASAWQP